MAFLVTYAKAPSQFGIRDEAIPAWLSLSNALDRMADDGRRPVCANNPDDWDHDAPLATRREAAEACQWCPALGPCGRFAEANRERTGIWAGVDRAGRPTTRKRVAA